MAFRKFLARLLFVSAAFLALAAPSTYTTNRHLEQQATGENTSTWGVRLNQNVIAIVDDDLGGTFDVSTTGGTTTLTTAQGANCFYAVTGVLASDATLQFPALNGFFNIRNGTSGAHTLTVGYSSGNTVVIPQGYSDWVYGDGTNFAFASTIAQSGSQLFATAGGTADALTAAMTPTVTTLSDGQQFMIRAAAANTTTTPTLAVDSTGAKTITKLGNQALAVGDIPRSGFEMIVRYNKSNDVYELLNPGSAAGDVTGPASSTDGHVALFNGTTGKIIKDAGSALGTAAALNVGTSASNIVQLDGSAKLPAVDGSQLTGLPLSGIQGTFKNLKIAASGATNHSAVVTADEVMLENTSNAYSIARSVSVTVNTSSSGANGLDTGTLAGSTWYSIWVIYNGSTVSGLASLSATAPTMPSGYTYKARVGWVRTDGTANKYLLQTLQKGRRAQYVVTSGTNTANLPIMASGSAGSITTPTWVSVATGSYVPSTAGHVLGVASAPSASMTMVAPNNGYGAYTSTSNPPAVIAGAGTNESANLFFDMILESTNIYWANNSASSLVACLGWEDNL